MRGERKLHKMIQKQGEKSKEHVMNELLARYPQYAVQPEKTKTPLRKRIAIFAPVATAAVCLAVILPCVFLLPGGDNGNATGDGSRYCRQSEYESGFVDYTIKEYNATNGTDIKYFYLDGKAENYTNSEYIDKKTHETLMLEEVVVCMEYAVEMTEWVSPINIRMDLFDTPSLICSRKKKINGQDIAWGYSMDDIYFMFNTKEYRYCVQIRTVGGTDKFYDIVADLLR